MNKKLPKKIYFGDMIKLEIPRANEALTSSQRESLPQKQTNKKTELKMKSR